MQLFIELGEVYESHKVFYDTVCMWGKKFLTGTESVKDAAKPGLSVTITAAGIVHVLKVRGIIESDCGYKIRDFSKAFRRLPSRKHFISKRILNLRNIFAIWIPHILKDDQNRLRVQTAKQFLKTFPISSIEIITFFLFFIFAIIICMYILIHVHMYITLSVINLFLNNLYLPSTDFICYTQVKRVRKKSLSTPLLLVLRACYFEIHMMIN